MRFIITLIYLSQRGDKHETPIFSLVHSGHNPAERLRAHASSHPHCGCHWNHVDGTGFRDDDADRGGLLSHSVAFSDVYSYATGDGMIVGVGVSGTMTTLNVEVGVAAGAEEHAARRIKRRKARRCFMGQL